MDAKVTLNFDKGAIEAAKKFAENQGISLSRLTEFLFNKLATTSYKDIESLPVADWVNMLAEGETTYRTKPKDRKSLKDEYFKSRKK
jgi:hypothetical protein